MKQRLLTFFSLLLITGLPSQAQPPAAEAVLKEGLQQAKAEKKHLFVMFHASWCGWCHKMDNSMNDPACKKFFQDHFVVRHLVVSESKDKKQLENPGAEAMLKQYHGDDSGIPYWLVFAADGRLLSDSKIRKEGEGPEQGYNVGCPASEKEVDFLIELLQKITPLTAGQLDIIRKRFRQNER